MTGTPPKDQRERDQAIAPSRSVHVEAPAGSGKTTVLMKRYLALLARVREPEDILALTFTRKAAGELRTRIQDEFSKRDESPPGDLPPHEQELRKLALAAVGAHADKGISFLERLQVNTFHGFCAQMLRLLPHQAGLPPDFGLLEEFEATRLQREAVELMRRRLAALPVSDANRQALVRRLVRLNNNWPRLAAELQGLLSRRDILGDFISLARESRDPAAYEAVLRDHLGALIRPRLMRLSQEFQQSEVGRQWPDLYRCLAETGAGLAETLPEALPGTDPADLNAWRAIADGILTSKGECYKRFAKPRFSKGFRDSPCCRLLQDLPSVLVEGLNFFRGMSSILMPGDEVAAVQDLIILLHQALTAYEEVCASRRSLDFTALEQAALRVLAADDRPALRFDRRPTHLLVDEFQDTSVNQITLLCRLLAGWQGEGGHSLMVVGDPKQSIYGWRQARLELFFQSRDAKRLPCPGAPGFEILALETNFRSTRKLIGWVNDVFGGTIMADKDTSGVEFHAAAARPGADSGSPPQLALFSGSDRQQVREREAAWLAGELSRLQKNLDPGETVGVLLFTRRHLPAYLATCRRAGLSLKVKDGLPLGDSLPVQHLHNAATALVRPHDDIAWAALLRGFAGPQPLGLLSRIAGTPGDFWSEKIRRYAASPDCISEVREFYRSLELAGKRVGREPLHDILADWLIRAEAWPKTAAWEQGPQGVADVKAYLDLAAAAAASTPEATLIQSADLLAKAYRPPDPRAQDSPVEVLTVHGVKGLEYDHVYVPHLDWQPLQTAKDDAPFLLEEVAGGNTALIALNRPYTQKEQSSLYQTLKATAKQRALGEARRLFYVAVTRARKRLQMSGLVKQNKAGDRHFPPDSPLGWLRQHYADGEINPGVVNLWLEPAMPVTLNDEVSELTGRPEALQPLPLEYDVQPEPRPYELQFPSQLSGKYGEVVGKREEAGDIELPAAVRQSSLTPGEKGQAEGIDPEPAARLRGDISHRLLDTLSRGGALPDPAAVASALYWVTASAEASLDLAREILEEIRACQADPFLARLLDENLPVARSEWLLEAWLAPPDKGSTPHPDPSRGEGKKEEAAVARGKKEEAAASGGEKEHALISGEREEALWGGDTLEISGNWPTLHRGQIDRLVFDGQRWWLLDYKTSRPVAGLDWEEFIAREVEKYRPQLLAYREMAARFYKIDPPESINAVLYFTACQRRVKL